MVDPTVGRAVHYVSRGSADGRYKSECRAATITAVGEGFVSLCVMNPMGLFFDEVVPEGKADEGGTWHWPERATE